MPIFHTQFTIRHEKRVTVLVCFHMKELFIILYNNINLQLSDSQSQRMYVIDYVVVFEFCISGLLFINYIN